MLSPVFFDTETGLIEPGNLVPPLVCVTIAEGHAPPIILAAMDGWARIHRLLEDPTRLFVGQNVEYDFAVLIEHAAAHGDETFRALVFQAYAQGRITDTKVRERLLAIQAGTLGKGFDASMEGILKRRFARDISDTKGPDGWRLRYSELIGIPIAHWPQAAKDYALNDAEYTREIYYTQGAESAATGYLVDGIPDTVTDEGPQSAESFALHLMACWGLRTDGKAVAALSHRLESNHKAMVDALTDAGIMRAKDGTMDTKALQARVSFAYQGLGLRPPTTPTGRVSTSRETLDYLSDATGDELFRLMADGGQDETIRKTFLPPLAQGIERPINPRWNILVESGRTSCGSPNLQNQPRKGGVRECFIPRKGWVYIAADYSMIELRALAQTLLDLFGHSEMAEALRSGMDLHLKMAASILGISYAAVVTRYEAGDAEIKDARQLAKAANFGFPGGLGAESFITFAKASYGVVLAEDPSEAIDRARGLKADYMHAYPEMHDYFRHVSRLTEAGGGVCTLTTTRSGRRRGGVGFCDGCNGGFQSPAADGAKAALFCVQEEAYTGRGVFWDGPHPSPLMNSRMVAFVHDEIIGEALEEAAPEAAERLATVMVKAMEYHLPDVPVVVEPLLMRRWYKDAKTVRDAGGRLIPWAPAS